MSLQRVEPVSVRPQREDVAAFCAALGLDELSDSNLPWTYPAVWLAHPIVREALLCSLRDGEVPVHEGQEFSYAGQGLEIDTSYIMHGSIRRENSGDKARIVVELQFDRESITVVRLTCRLIAVSGAWKREHAGSRP
ncbi:MAG TPA: hypothetical protein VG271_11740 [Beijerinckiaceae bacterium]|jgi:hypothetical protein|nr:hypothetical protein [Beijerinckiaceae bacterium]